MLILYNIHHDKIFGLENYKDLNITKEINKLDIIHFSYPINDPKADYIKEECYIRTKDNEFVVKEINFNDDDFVEIVGQLNIETIIGNTMSHFETVEQKCTDSVNLALAGTDWTIGSCNVTKKRTTRKNQCTSYDILQAIQKSYNCEMTFDAINKEVNVYQSMGNDKGAYFTEQLNLNRLSTQRNSYDYITRLIPCGKDNLDIKAINDGKEYVENYQYSNKVITAYWSDDRYTDASSLKEDATERLDYLSMPYKSYSADVIDLANLNDKYKNILDYSLGDTITLLSDSQKLKEKQRIIKLVNYIEEPERNTVEIANKVLSIDDLNTRFSDTSDVVDNVTTSDGYVDGSKVTNIDWDNIEHVHIEMADIEELNATIANIGKLNATEGNITILNAVNANITNLMAHKADIDDLTANTARINTLEADSASIQTLLAGNISAENMQTGFITASSGLIANGAIADAQILNLSVSKILAGTISTGKFVVASDDGNLKIQDNTIHVWDDTGQERISLGKNGDDYNLLVRASDGETVLFGNDGVTHAGITQGAIDDTNIAENAAISGGKIDMASLFTTMNDSSQTLKTSKIFYDDEGQTLDVYFSNLSKTVTDTDTLVSWQGTQITAIQGQIENKIWQSDITAATGPQGEQIQTLHDQYSDVTQTLGGITSQVGDITTTITKTIGTTDPYSVEVSSSNGGFFRNGQIDTVLTAKVFLGFKNVTDDIDPSRFKWTRKSKNQNTDDIWNANHVLAGKQIHVTKDDLLNNAIFTCEIYDS